MSADFNNRASTETPPSPGGGIRPWSSSNTPSIRKRMNNSNNARPILQHNQSSTQSQQQKDQLPGEQPQQFEQMPSVKPVIDDHDRAWAEIEVLDDAVEMAHQIKANKSFFGSEHAEAMDQLRSQQTELAQLMSDSDLRHHKAQYKSLWENNDIDSLRRNLFDEEHFEAIEKHILTTIDKLDDVAKCMEQVDEHSKDFWQTS